MAMALIDVFGHLSLLERVHRSNHANVGEVTLASTRHVVQSVPLDHLRVDPEI
jgi:hypothetical protein